MAKGKTKTSTVPPASAVARDPHWAKKMERLRNRKPLTRGVTLYDDEAALAVAEATQKVRLARREARQRLIKDSSVDEVTEELLSSQPDVVAAEEDLEEAKAEQAEADVTVTLAGLPSDVFAELVGEHPPTDEDRDDGRAYNVKRFAPALVSACSVDPMDVKTAAELLGGEYPVLDKDGKHVLDDGGEPKWASPEHAILTQGEAAILFQTAVAVNQDIRVSALGKGSRQTRG